ncbi:hypothetical protein BKA70DRAFT_1308836 [Coprinopsis sp. MPI-PUGE-AT-0042]|nr:hypothetical protein BKA70DRAFT_1308836 [Coprinopsis sp. MPI-PUGE-AT-0042]
MSYPEVEEAHRLLDSHILTMEKEILIVRSQRNRLAPISRLPVEMLTNIFLECAASPWPTSNSKKEGSSALYTKWTVVSHVCRQWRDVALGCSELWSTLNQKMSVKWMEAMIERSKASPISILNYNPGAIDPKTNKSQTLLKALSETGKLRKIELRLGVVHWNEEAAKVISSLNSPAPFLVDFSMTVHLSIRGRSLRSLPRDFLGGDAPMLRRLELIHCHPSWNPTLFSPNLTSLRLTNPPFLTGVLDEPSTPSSREFAKVLARIPWLTNLDLGIQLPDMTTLDNAATTFEFLSLRKLRLVGECGNLAGLLGRIRIPSTTEVKIYCADVKKGAVILLDLALERTWITQPTLSRLRLSQFGLGGYLEGFNMPSSVHPESNQLVISMDRINSWSGPETSGWEPEPFPSPHYLLDTVCWDDVETVDVECPLGLGARDEMWANIFEKMKQVKDLGLVGKSAREFMDALMHFTKPQGSHGGSNFADVVPLPRLETLKLHKCNVVLDARSMASYGPNTRETMVALGSIAEYLEQRNALGAPKVKEVAFELCGGFTTGVGALFKKLQALEIAESFHRRECSAPVEDLDVELGYEDQYEAQEDSNEGEDLDDDYPYDDWASYDGP